MNWKNDSNHSTIAALDKAIEICAKRNELSSVHEKICKMGKAEISACVDQADTLSRADGVIRQR